MNKSLVGKISTFGGPKDTGVLPSEGVALYGRNSCDHYRLFLPGQVGLARGLNPRAYYCAMRWDYKKAAAQVLRGVLIGVSLKGRDEWVWLHPADWGPAQHTRRIIDVSPAAMQIMGASTDAEVEVRWYFGQLELPVLG